jgi:hypothetical protein
MLSRSYSLVNDAISARIGTFLRMITFPSAIMVTLGPQRSSIRSSRERVKMFVMAWAVRLESRGKSVLSMSAARASKRNMRRCLGSGAGVGLASKEWRALWGMLAILAGGLLCVCDLFKLGKLVGDLKTRVRTISYSSAYMSRSCKTIADVMLRRSCGGMFRAAVHILHNVFVIVSC